MENLFSFDYQGAPFVFLGTAHIAALCFLVLLNLFLLRDRKNDEQARRKTRWAIAIILWVSTFPFFPNLHFTWAARYRSSLPDNG
ncbi:MAG: hypothetical protein Q7J07_04560 [Pelolinea sp.]|nr:hypothetical protein [Pelolinea sp.]